jgi:hypothetical protein
LDSATQLNQFGITLKIGSMKTATQFEPIEYKSRFTVKQEAEQMLAELTNINNRIINGEFELQPTERMLCREYLDYTLKHAPALKDRICY